MRKKHGKRLRSVAVMPAMPFLRFVLGHKLANLPADERSFHICDLDERDCIDAWEYLVSLGHASA